MKIYKCRIYCTVTAFFIIGLIISWLIPTVFIINNLGDSPIILTRLDLFLNIMGSHSNYLSYNRIMVLYMIVFVFALNCIFFKDAPSFLIRIKSRNSYVNGHIKDTILLSLIFVVLIEIINIILGLLFFGFDIVLSSKLILYSLIDLLTEFIFYMRAGIVLFIAGIFINKKIAPFICFAIYFLEYFSKDYLPFLYDIWLPYKDSVQITGLLMNNIQPASTIPIILRGFTINLVLIFISYYLFKKKDIIKNEKK